MAKKNRWVVDGKVWLSVPEAARQLNTTSPAIRRMMSSNVLEWCQLKIDSSLVVSADSVVKKSLEKI